MSEKKVFKNLFIVLFFLVVTVLMTFGNLKTKKGGIMEDAIQNKNDSYYLMNKEAQEKFQGTEAFVIILRFPDGIQSEKDILKIKEYQEYLTKNLNNITVVSLNNLDSFSKYNNLPAPINFTDTKNFLLQDRNDKFDIEKWKSEISKQKNLVKFFVDENFQYVNFIIYPYKNYDEINVFRNVVEVLEERKVKEWEWFIKKDIQPKDENVLVAGWIIGRGLMDGALNADVIKGILIGVILSFIVFYFFTKSFLQSFIASFFVIGFSVFWVRGEIGLLSLLPFDIELFEIKERVFVLMAYTNCVVQGVSFALHMFESFNEVEEDCPSVNVSKKWFLVKREVMESILITVFIAFTGFITLVNFNVKAIQELGILSALGVINLFLLSTILVPAIHTIFYSSKKVSKNIFEKEKKERKSFILSFLNKINQTLNSISGKILIVVILIGLCWWVFVGFYQNRLIVGSEALEYLKGTIVDRSNDYLNQNGKLGFSNFEFLAVSKNKNIDISKNYAFALEMRDFSREVQKINGVKSVNSVLNTVEQMSGLFDEDFVKNEKELNYIFDNLENKLDKKIVSQLYNEDSYRFTITTDEESSNDWGRITDEVLKLSEKYDQLDKVLFFGDTALYYRVDDYVIKGKVWNVVSSQLVVVIICILWLFFTLKNLKISFLERLFISIKVGFIMSLPLLFATECILLVMMYLKIPLDISTAVIGVTAIAASIDFSIYFVAEYKKTLLNKEKNVLKIALDKQGKIILMDMLLNQLFFTPLIFSSFLPVQRLGWMLVIMLFFAAIGSLIIMPTMLVWAFKDLENLED